MLDPTPQSVSIDSMMSTISEMQRKISISWEILRNQEKRTALMIMGDAAINPLARTHEMRLFVELNIPRSGRTLSDHLKDFGFQIVNRKNVKKLVYRRKDGRVFQDIVIDDSFCVEDLEIEVFNHLYVKFYTKRQLAIQKAKTTRMQNRMRHRLPDPH